MEQADTRPVVVVVGGGITGLVASRELAKDPGLEVVLLEADERLGGQVRTVELDGAHVDVGAEAIHLGAPHVAALVRELGIDDDVVGAAPGSSVMLTRRGLRPLPAGVGPTGPTRIWPVLRSRILTPRGLLRAGLEPLAASRRVTTDTSVGAFTTARFGREVTDTFVDPLLGNLHGGDVFQLSLTSTAPQLLADAREGRSLLAKGLWARKPSGPSPRTLLTSLRRRADRGTGTTPATATPTSATGAGRLPFFATWPEGLRRFTDALAEQSGAEVRTGTPVRSLERTADGRWLVRLPGDELLADHVVLTTPADVTARLLADVDAEASAAIGQVPLVSVATVVLGFEPGRAATNPLLRDSNGILLPSTRARTFKAATNLGRKWPGLGSSTHLLRASVGHSSNTLADSLGDDEMTSRVAAELRHVAGLDVPIELGRVYRWPKAMPQLQPGHKERIERARASLRERGGLSVAGSGVDGLGIGSTVRSGQQVAREVADELARRHAVPTAAPDPTQE